MATRACGGNAGRVGGAQRRAEKGEEGDARGTGTRDGQARTGRQDHRRRILSPVKTGELVRAGPGAGNDTCGGNMGAGSRQETGRTSWKTAGVPQAGIAGS